MNKKLIALIVGGLIVLAAIIYFIFIYDYNSGNQPADNNTANQSNQPAPVVSTSTPEVVPGRERSAEEKNRDDISQLSISFAERFGSSSSQADFSNLEDLELFMTPAMQARTESYIAAERKKPVVAGYQGTITKAIIADTTAVSDSSATVVVKTKRQETKEDAEPTTYSQNLNLSLQKINGEWKVDSAEWMK